MPGWVTNGLSRYKKIGVIAFTAYINKSPSYRTDAAEREQRVLAHSAEPQGRRPKVRGI